jgi:hypothetical protein
LDSRKIDGDQTIDEQRGLCLVQMGLKRFPYSITKLSIKYFKNWVIQFVSGHECRDSNQLRSCDDGAVSQGTCADAVGGDLMGKPRQIYLYHAEFGVLES